MLKPLELKDTLNLPQTKFPMKANLQQNEPKWLEKWQQDDLYGQIRAARKDAPYLYHARWSTLRERSHSSGHSAQ